MWTVQEAEAKMSEVLERARGGEAQVIEARDPCVVVCMDEYRRLKGRATGPHLGEWLVENLKGLDQMELPARGDDRPVPFSDWPDEDSGP